MEQAFAKLRQTTDLLKAELHQGDYLRYFRMQVASSGFPRWNEWHPSVKEAVAAGYKKRIADTKFLMNMAAHMEVGSSPCGLQRAARLAGCAAAWHALATVGIDCARVAYAEAHDAPKNSPN